MRLFNPLRGFFYWRSDPRLTPWAVFLCRFAAFDCKLRKVRRYARSGRCRLLRFRDCGTRGLNHFVWAEAEFLQYVLQRRRGSKRVHTDYLAMRSNVLRPAKCRRLLYRDSRLYFLREYLLLIFLALPFKDGPGRHADHARLHSFRFQLLISSDAELNLAAAGHQYYLRLAIWRICQDVSALGHACGGSVFCTVKRRDRLTCQHQRCRLVLQLHDDLPCFDDFVGVGRTQERQSRYCAQ